MEQESPNEIYYSFRLKLSLSILEDFSYSLHQISKILSHSISLNCGIIFLTVCAFLFFSCQLATIDPFILLPIHSSSHSFFFSFIHLLIHSSSHIHFLSFSLIFIFFFLYFLSLSKSFKKLLRSRMFPLQPDNPDKHVSCQRDADKIIHRHERLQ